MEPNEYQRSADGKTWVTCSEADYETMANTGFRHHRKRPVGSGDDKWWYITNFGTPLPYEARRAVFLEGLRSLYQQTGIYVSPACGCSGYMGAECAIEVFDDTTGGTSMLELTGDYEMPPDIDEVEFVTKREREAREKRRTAAEKRRAKRAKAK